VVTSLKDREGGIEEEGGIKREKIEDGIVGGHTGVVAGTVSGRLAKVDTLMTRNMKLGGMTEGLLEISTRTGTKLDRVSA